jgi:hypothetical protein
MTVRLEFSLYHRYVASRAGIVECVPLHCQENSKRRVNPDCRRGHRYALIKSHLGFRAARIWWIRRR